MINKTAEKFFNEEWGDRDMKIHSECVIEACLGMTVNTNLDKDIFIISGWIHDMGRKEDKDNHHIISINYLDKFLSMHPEFSGLRKEIEDCIINHRSGKIPRTIYGKVFQLADKVALLNRRWIK